MKVVLLGKKGMLGSCFLKYLSGKEDFEMYALDKNNLDISDFSQLEKVFRRISPDFVLNCAAFTDVDGCESDRDLALRVNGLAAGEIARACKKENATLVHFSTDYVFDGKKEDGYREDDSPAPINVYGESKLKGEKLVMSNCDDYYIVRTSWLFGENGKNFVDTMVRLGREKSELAIVGDQFGAPTYTKDLCEAVTRYFLTPFVSHLPEHHARSLETNGGAEEKLDFGIYHLTNSGRTNWSDFARRIFSLMKLDVEVKDISTKEFGRPANRPENSVLLNTKIDGKMRSWDEALEVYMKLNFGV